MEFILKLLPLVITVGFYKNDIKYILLMLSVSTLYFINYNTYWILIIFSLILQCSFLFLKNKNRIFTISTNINKVILSVTLLAILLNLKLNYFPVILLTTLSIQFLLIASLSYIRKCRNWFYIIPLLIFQVLLIFDLHKLIFVTISQIGIILLAQLNLNSKYNELKRKVTEKNAESKVIYELFNLIQKEINSGKSYKSILNIIMKSMKTHLEADSAAVIFITENGFETITKVGNYSDIDLSKLGFYDIYIENTENTPNKRFHKYANCRENYVSSLIIKPIVTESTNYGYLVLQNNSFLKLFSDNHLNICEIYLNFIHSSLESLEKNKKLLEKKEIEKELKIATKIQQSLIPKEIKETSLSLAVLNKPAKGMSGDYYNIIPLKDNRTLITICDVAGKGIPAAIITVIINTTMKLLANKAKNASSLISWVNNILCQNKDIERYATMSCLIIDQKNNTISYSNAGHHPTLIKRDSTVMELSGKGLPIGIQKNTNYQEVAFEYSKNDMLLLYTDGISESMNIDGEQYGISRIKQNLLKQKVNSPTHIIATLFQESEEYSYKDFAFDDRTILGVSL